MFANLVEDMRNGAGELARRNEHQRLAGVAEVLVLVPEVLVPEVLQ